MRTRVPPVAARIGRCRDDDPLAGQVVGPEQVRPRRCTGHQGGDPRVGREPPAGRPGVRRHPHRVAGPGWSGCGLRCRSRRDPLHEPGTDGRSGQRGPGAERRPNGGAPAGGAHRPAPRHPAGRCGRRAAGRGRRRRRGRGPTPPVPSRRRRERRCAPRGGGRAAPGRRRRRWRAASRAGRRHGRGRPPRPSRPRATPARAGRRRAPRPAGRPVRRRPPRPSGRGRRGGCWTSWPVGAGGRCRVAARAAVRTRRRAVAPGTPSSSSVTPLPVQVGQRVGRDPAGGRAVEGDQARHRLELAPARDHEVAEVLLGGDGHDTERPCVRRATGRAGRG